MKLKKIDDEDGFETYCACEENKGVFITHITSEKRQKGLMKFFKKSEKTLETSVAFSEGEMLKEKFNCNSGEYPIVSGIEKIYLNGKLKSLGKTKIALENNDFEVIYSVNDVNFDLMGEDMELTEKYYSLLRQLPEDIKKNIRLDY
ncbi:MAG: hypothetical protein AABW81_00630 [Nanoarchaeota archaeon]